MSDRGPAVEGRGISTVAEVVGAVLARLGVGQAVGVVGSGNFHVTNALRAHGVPFVAARHEGGAATIADAYAGQRTEQIAKRIAAQGRWTALPVETDGDGERIDPRALSARLDALLPAARTVAVDSGNFMGYPAAYLAVPDAAGFCFTQSFQSIGLGLATAIGAALARPDRLPVAALGDGGFLMGISELETLVRLGIGMLVVVYDDAGYGAEVHHFVGADHGGVTFPDTDLAAIAAGYGCASATVRAPGDLDAVAGWLAGPRDRPMLVDAKVTRDEPSWWLAEAFRGH